MKLIEMTSSKKPMPLSHKGNVKTPERNVVRMENSGWQRAEMPKPKPNLKTKGEK
jgi:hypothetical protein